MYWVNAIVLNLGTRKPCHIANSTACEDLNQAKSMISRLSNQFELISAWIDKIEDDVKITVFHECYVDALGNIRKNLNTY